MRVRLVTVFVGAILLTLASIGLRAQGSPSGQLVSSPFFEHVPTEAPLSGQTVVGIMVSGSPAAIDDHLYIYALPGTSNRSICLQVHALDGRYRSENDYSLPGQPSAGYVRLPYPTRYKDFFQNHKPEDIAILAEHGRCGASSGRYLPATAEIVPGDVRGLRIAVIAGRARVSIVSLDDPLAHIASCSTIREGRQIYFDTFCELDVTMLSHPLLRAEVVEQEWDDPPYRTPMVVELGGEGPP